jgi:predicted negative regulator of RcsB-dependent stress response
LLHERQKEFSDAEAEYKQVLTLDRHSTDPHNVDSHANDPQNTEAAIGLTNIYMKSGRIGEAEPLLRRLAAERPDDAGIHLQLGRVLAAQGKKDDAIAEIQTRRSGNLPTFMQVPGKMISRKPHIALLSPPTGVTPSCTAAWGRPCCVRKNSQRLNRNFWRRSG